MSLAAGEFRVRPKKTQDPDQMMLVQSLWNHPHNTRPTPPPAPTPANKEEGALDPPPHTDDTAHPPHTERHHGTPPSPPPLATPLPTRVGEDVGAVLVGVGVWPAWQAFGVAHLTASIVMLAMAPASFSHCSNKSSYGWMGEGSITTTK
jgi:hypothetical protein